MTVTTDISLYFLFSFHVHAGVVSCLSFSLQVSFFLFIVFVVYTMLPFSMRDAIIASVLTSASHTVVLSVCLSTTADHMEPVVWQVRCSTFGVGGSEHTNENELNQFLPTYMTYANR